MTSRWFTVAELIDMNLPWTAEYVESRGKGKTGEFVDLVFRFDYASYHVLMHIAPDGTQTYPDEINLEGTCVVDCPEVELYATRRLVTLFRKVSDDLRL